jgi:hypothetical protein
VPQVNLRHISTAAAAAMLHAAAAASKHGASRGVMQLQGFVGCKCVGLVVVGAESAGTMCAHKQARLPRGAGSARQAHVFTHRPATT